MTPTINLTTEQSDNLIRVADMFFNTKKDNIYYGKDGVTKLIAGIEKGFSAIKGSYGSGGSNAILEAGYLPGHEIVNDGRKILDSIKLADPVENIGLNILKEVAKKADEISGDGRKTSVILTHAIITEGFKAKESPMEIKRSLDECLPIILKSIDDQTKTITPADIENIAAVASESRDLGKIFGDIYRQIGKEGIVELDTSNLSETTYEITEGVKLLNCGFHPLSFVGTQSYMANEDKGRQAVYKNPYVLIVKENITKVSDIDGILKTCLKNARNELVIFCDEMDVNVFKSFASLQLKGFDGTQFGFGNFKTLIIKAPTLWKDWIYDDFSKITGATIIDGITTSLKNLQLHHLGSCEKIIVTKDQTIVLGIKDIKEHLKILEEINTNDAKIRIARLCTKTAILRLGANSEAELSHLKGKALDARNASYLALQGGIVPGAGQAFKLAAYELSKTATLGTQILEKALLYPIKLICENIGVEPMNHFDKINQFDVQDPAIVVKNSIQNALSVAGIVLTAKTVVTLK